MRSNTVNGMTKLEQTIIERAHEHLSAVKAFYAQIEAGTTDADARDDYRRDHAQLNALLEFGHMSDSGMSPDGRAALLAVEEADIAALREYSAPTIENGNLKMSTTELVTKQETPKDLNSVPIDPIFHKTASAFFSVIAENHAFTLKALTDAEAQRLLNFIQLAEIRRYPEFSDWPEKVFLTAKHLCEQAVYTLIHQD